MSTYYEVKISAENQEQAETILNSLLEKKLVTGGQFLIAPTRFLWKGKIENMNYVTTTSYTAREHKNAAMEDIQKTSVENVPMITFTIPDSMNQELCDWINETLV